MARKGLRKQIAELGVNEALAIPEDYEESTIRNAASVVGRALNRSYSAVKDTDTRTFTVIRNS